MKSACIIARFPAPKSPQFTAPAPPEICAPGETPAGTRAPNSNAENRADERAFFHQCADERALERALHERLGRRYDDRSARNRKRARANVWRRDAAPRRSELRARTRCCGTEKRAKNKTVTIYPVGRGDERQTLAWVFAGKQSLNAEILRDGLAWWDARQASGEAKLKTLMNQARAAHRGLWSENDPIAPWAFVAEEDYEPLDIALQKNAATFPLLKPTIGKDGKPTFANLTLNAHPVKYATRRYDGFRFKAPADNARDFVWAFVEPPSFTGWYVVARRGDMKRFTLFFPHQRTEFGGLEALLPRDSKTLTLQHLSGDSMTPGAEYIVWFSFDDDKPVTISLAFTFADVDKSISDSYGGSTDSGTLQNNIIKALGLTAK